jgi:hypothetical protein
MMPRRRLARHRSRHTFPPRARLLSACTRDRVILLGQVSPMLTPRARAFYKCTEANRFYRLQLRYMQQRNVVHATPDLRLHPRHGRHHHRILHLVRNRRLRRFIKPSCTAFLTNVHNWLKKYLIYHDLSLHVSGVPACSILSTTA